MPIGSNGLTRAAAALALLLGIARVAQGQTAETSQSARAAQLHAQPGDRVTLHVFGEPGLTDNATVDEQGRVYLPRIGGLQANAMSIAQLRDTIRARLSAFLRNPAIEVSVLRRVVVNGEVVRPGVYHVDLTANVSEAIAQAGGLRETAHSQKVYLLRGTERRHIPDWEGNESRETDLMSGDQVIVGRKSWLALNVIPVVSVATSVVALIISLRRPR